MSKHTCIREFSFGLRIRSKGKASSESDLQAMVVPAEAMKGTDCVGVPVGFKINTVCTGLTVMVSECLHSLSMF